MRTTVFVVTFLIALLPMTAWADETDLVWGTFLGGDSTDYCYSITLDGAGNVYVSGCTYSSDFPFTEGVFDETFNGRIDIYIAKLNPLGSDLIYATFLGGDWWDYGSAIAVDGSGNAYVTGRTVSSDFPTTPGAFDTSYGGSGVYQGDAFVSKLNANGSALVYSTYLGGSARDGGSDIVLDGSSNVYVTGRTRSYNFPTTAEAFDTTYNGGYEEFYGDIFVTKLNASGSALIYSTFIGGVDADVSYSINCDGLGNAYVTGWTNSLDFPTTSGAFDRILDGSEDAVITKLNSSGSALDYSTFLGGIGGESAYCIAVNGLGNSYVIGVTTSADFPITIEAFDTTFGGATQDAFVTKLDPVGAELVFSTFLGGNGNDWARGIAIDDIGNVFVTGYTRSSDFPTTEGAYRETYDGVEDVFVTKLSNNGSILRYSTFLGGSGSDRASEIAQDDSGNVYIVGDTESANFPTTIGAFDTTFNGGSRDGFVTKLCLSAPGRIDDLTIALNREDIILLWTEPYDDVGVIRYVVYRSTIVGSLGDSLAGATDTTFLDVGAAGNCSINYFYSVKAVDGAGNKSVESNSVGEFDQNLINGE